MEIRFDNHYAESWLLNRVNGFFAQPAGESRHIVPPVDVTEDKDAYHFYFEMPGLKSESLDARVEDGHLIVTAERKWPESVQDTKVRVAERGYGTFRRTFELPRDASQEKIEAGYKDGVLEVTVEKKPEAKSNKIQVNRN